MLATPKSGNPTYLVLPQKRNPNFFCSAVPPQSIDILQQDGITAQDISKLKNFGNHHYIDSDVHVGA